MAIVACLKKLTSGEEKSQREREEWHGTSYDAGSCSKPSSKDVWAGIPLSVRGHFSIPEGARTRLKKPVACRTEPELSDQDPEHGTKHLEPESEI